MRKSAAKRAPEAISERKQKFRSDGAICPSHDRGSRRRRLLAAEPDAEAVIHRAIAAAAEIADADVGEAELAVMLTDDAGIRTLNSNWRGIDKPTNVLSFPALQPTGAGAPGRRAAHARRHRDRL